MAHIKIETDNQEDLITITFPDENGKPVTFEGKVKQIFIALATGNWDEEKE